MAHICAPLIRFRPLDPPAFPVTWEAREYRAALRLFGVIPLGWQVIGVEFVHASNAPYELLDRGRGPLMRVWNHRILIAPDADGLRYTDELTYDAGWLSHPLRPFLRFFFAHRQQRLARLLAQS
ncbi:MAG: hypothetical protein CR993_00580 [Rhodobacterales bacterium]|nr:MAG: hypothetical protein CR993_00580 [Rhodobacterales bacterium]